MKPKVITQAPASPQADAAPATGAATAGGAGLRATVIAPGMAPAAAPAAPRPAPTTVVAQSGGAPMASPSASSGGLKAPPSVVPGTIRRGVEVSLPALAQRFPAAMPEALQQAQRLLQATIVDTLSASQAARWGEEAQQRYGVLVDASLQITQATTVQTSLRHVARLHALLQGIADEWVAPAKSPLLFWKSNAGPAAQLQASQGELAQLRQHLAEALPALRGLQADLQGIGSELAPLAVQLEALSLAAHYLADTLDSAADPRAHALMQRASALAQTVLHIQGGLQLRQGSQHSLDGLIHRIQDTVLLALPAWMEKVALVTQARQLNDTERYALAQQLQGLLGLLHLS